MQETKYYQKWKSWIKIGRLVPLATILAGVTIGILSILGRLQVTMAEGVIIALLTLLSFDALVERLSLLEKIDEKLERWPAQEILRDRSKLIRMEELAAGATEICASGVSLYSIIPPYYDFYLKKLQEGCHLRFMVLNPNSPGADIFNATQRVQTAVDDIKTSLKFLDALLRYEKTRGKCEVRLSQFHLPFSMVIIDGQKDNGSMISEVLVYKRSLPDRPHLYLTKRDHGKWFLFFYNQFETLWQDSSVWQSA